MPLAYSPRGCYNHFVKRVLCARPTLRHYGLIFYHGKNCLSILSFCFFHRNCTVLCNCFMNFHRFAITKYKNRRDAFGIAAVTDCQKASQSFAPAGAKMIWIIFCGGVYVAENTTQSASVEILRLAQNLCARRAASLFKRKPSEAVFV